MTPEDLIHSRLRASWDENRYKALFRNVARFNGCDADTVVPKQAGIVPHWPKLRQNIAKLGEAADSVYAMEQVQARLRSREIRPDFIDLESEITKDARSEWWMARCRGVGNLPGWSPVHDQFTMWGIGFGAGVIEVGRDVDSLTGKSYVTHKHVEGFNFLCDPFANSLHHIKYGASLEYIPVETFERMYPKAKSAQIVQIEGVDNDMSYAAQAVRVVRYYDESTFALLVNDIDGEFLEHRENVYQRVMFVTMAHMLMPGAQFGLGKVDLMMPLQETRNRIRRHYMNRIDNPGFKIISSGMLSDEHIEELNDPGAEREMIYPATRPINRDDVPVFEVGPAPMDPALERAMQEMERAFNPASSTNDFSSGRSGAGVDTATEAELIVQESSGQQSLIQRTYAEAMENLIQITFHAAKLVDEYEVPVMVKGVRLVLNGEDEDPEIDLSLDALFEQESQVLLSEESLFSSDADRKRRGRTIALQNLLQIATSTGLNPQPIVKEIFENEGFDFSRLEQSAAPATMAPGMPTPPTQAMA